MTATGTLGVIAGTGVADWPGAPRSLDGPTPWGDTSSPVLEFGIGADRWLLMGRHGFPHTILPHRINYRANLWQLRALGARRVLSINAVGSLRSDWPPGTLVVPDQLIDDTARPDRTTAGRRGSPWHAEFAEPFGGWFRTQLLKTCRALEIEVIDGGCYAAVDGPRLETRAEIARLRRDGGDVVGMTAMPEAAIAREFGLDYASLSLVANAAAGLGPDISLDEVRRVMASAAPTLARVVKRLAADRPAG